MCILMLLYLYFVRFTCALPQTTERDLKIKTFIFAALTLPIPITQAFLAAKKKRRNLYKHCRISAQTQPGVVCSSS